MPEEVVTSNEPKFRLVQSASISAHTPQSRYWCWSILHLRTNHTLRVAAVDDFVPGYGGRRTAEDYLRKLNAGVHMYHTFSSSWEKPGRYEMREVEDA